MTKSATAARQAWDGYDAYLFDIDGTLLHCSDAVHYFAFCEALTSIAGRPLNLDGVVAQGNVDVGILRDALQLAGIAEEKWRPRLAEAKTGMCGFVERNANDLRIEVLPGVVPLLAHLRAKGAVLGVATGNLAGIGRVKLKQCDLFERFDFGGFSDAYEFRRDVFKGALDEALARSRAAARVCVVGDTPEDIRAARANGLDVIAVATGIYPLSELAAESPDWCVSSLETLLSDGH